LGIKKEEAEKRKAMATAFTGLELWPAATMEWNFGPDPATPEAERQGPQAEAQRTVRHERVKTELCPHYLELVQRSPQRLTVGTWMRIEAPCLEQQRSGQLPSRDRWFATAVPAGSALLEGLRIARVPGRKGQATPELMALHELAPFDPTLRDQLAPSADE